MFINILSSILITLLLTGCGGVSSDSSLNNNKSQNNLGYYDDLTLFYNDVITGTWLQKDTKYGFETMFYFENSDTLDMNDTYVDSFYDNQNYGVDTTGDKLFTYKFYKYSETIENNDTNITTTYYDHNTSIIEQYDFNSFSFQDSCLNISKYENRNSDNTYIGDYQFCKNKGFTQYSFATYSLAGQWIQYEYDDNDTAKINNGLGIEFLYQFDQNNRISMNISLIDTWIPLGKYATNENQTTLTFEMGSATSLQQFEFIEHRDSVPIQYQDENNETQSIDIPCIKVAKYDLYENNNTKKFDTYYQLCKKY